MANIISKATERKLVKIAQKEIPALENRADLEQQMSDELDFIDSIAVWSIKAALIAAYQLGRDDEKKTTEKTKEKACVYMRVATEAQATAERIRITKVDGNWIFGIIDGTKFQAKVYEEPSEYGIDGGNVSKLWIDGICNYDRGWDKKAQTASGKAMVKSLLEYFADPENCKVRT